MVAKALWFAEPSGQPPLQQQQKQQEPYWAAESTAAPAIAVAAARPSLSPMLAAAPPPDGEASEWITTRGGGGGGGDARRATCGVHPDAGAGVQVGTHNGGLAGHAACADAMPQLSAGHRESSGGSSLGQVHGRGSSSQLDGLPGRPPLPLPHVQGLCTGASVPHGEGHTALRDTQQQQQPSHRSSTSLLDDSPVGPQGISAAAVATATTDLTDLTDDDVVEGIGAAVAGGTCANGGRRGSSSRSDFAFDTPAGGDDTPDLIARNTPQGPPAIASSTAKDPGAPLQQQQQATQQPSGGQEAAGTAAAGPAAAAAAAAFRPAAFRAGVKRGLPASLAAQAAKRPANNSAVGQSQPMGQAHATASAAAAATPAADQDAGPITRSQVLQLIEQQGPVTAPSLVQQLCGTGAGGQGAGACPRRLGQLQIVLQELVGEFEVMRKGEGSRRSEVVLDDTGTTYEVL